MGSPENTDDKMQGGFTERGAVRKSNAFTEGEPAPFHSEYRPENATLRLIRNTWGGVFVSFTVEFDGGFAGDLAYGTTLKLSVRPGKHLLFISGGGAFFGASESFVVEECDNVTYTVGYSWYGGIQLSKVWD